MKLAWKPPRVRSHGFPTGPVVSLRLYLQMIGKSSHRVESRIGTKKLNQVFSMGIMRSIPLLLSKPIRVFEFAVQLLAAEDHFIDLVNTRLDMYHRHYPGAAVHACFLCQGCADDVGEGGYGELLRLQHFARQDKHAMHKYTKRLCKWIECYGCLP